MTEQWESDEIGDWDRAVALRAVQKYRDWAVGQTDEALRELTIKTFADTVEYGAVCSDCCSSQGEGDKVLCEMSERPLKPDNYCPQQILTIDTYLAKLAPIIRAKIDAAVKDALVQEAARHMGENKPPKQEVKL